MAVRPGVGTHLGPGHQWSTDRATPDLTFVELIHQAPRVDGERLRVTVAALKPEDSADRLPRIREFFENYLEQLVAHHTNEDMLFFPALAARVGEDEMHLSTLVSQHEQLDGDLQAVEAGLVALADPDCDFPATRTRLVGALTKMLEQLNTHLDLEERTALPLFATDMPAAEYGQLESKVRKATPREHSNFLIPWLVENASPDQRQRWFRSVPPMRIVYLLNRRRYRRLHSALASG